MMKKEIKKKLGLYIISREKMKSAKGREGDCLCTCPYEGQGGSDTADNAEANIANDLKTPTILLPSD